MTRQEANREIVGILAVLVELHPDIRFTQLLCNAGVLRYDLLSSGASVVRDDYYVESEQILKRVKKSP